MDKIDICVLTAGRFDLLQFCLNSIEKEIARNEFKANVYVLDNGSDFKEAQMFSTVLKSPIITQTKRINTNVGFPRGANSVIRMGANELFLFVSDDIVFLPGAIKSVIDTMKSDSQIGICGLKLLFSKYSNDPQRPGGKVQHVGHSVNLRGEIIHPFLGWSADNPRTCVSGERFSVTGAVFASRRTVFYKAGKFNEQYLKGYFEDVELALHVKGLGYKIWLDANAVAEHYVGATFQEKQKDGGDFRGNLGLFMERNRQYLYWDDWKLR